MSNVLAQGIYALQQRSWSLFSQSRFGLLKYIQQKHGRNLPSQFISHIIKHNYITKQLITKTLIEWTTLDHIGPWLKSVALSQSILITTSIQSYFSHRGLHATSGRLQWILTHAAWKKTSESFLSFWLFLSFSTLWLYYNWSFHMIE